MCIAKEADGSQFAYLCRDKKVYHIPEEAGSTADETIAMSYDSWDTLEAFLKNCIQMAEDPDKPANG